MNLISELEQIKARIDANLTSELDAIKARIDAIDMRLRGHMERAATPQGAAANVERVLHLETRIYELNEGLARHKRHINRLRRALHEERAAAPQTRTPGVFTLSFCRRHAVAIVPADAEEVEQLCRLFNASDLVTAKGDAYNPRKRFVGMAYVPSVGAIIHESKAFAQGVAVVIPAEAFLAQNRVK